MKKLIALLCLLSSPAWALATPVNCPTVGGTQALNFTSSTNAWSCNTVVGGGSGTVPGGSNTQIQWNNAGTMDGLTMSGDATMVSSTGVLTVTKSAGAFNSVGNFSVATNKFNVTAASGNTLIAGTLGVTGAITGNLTGNADTATAASTGATTAIATNASFFPLFVSSASNSNQPFNLDASGLTYNPSTNTLTTTTFVGALTGNASTVTTNANLTGVITSSGNATSIASQTGTGTKFVVDTSPTIVTPTLTTSATVPLVIGGTGAASSLTLESTSGSGTTDFIAFKTASQSEKMRINTSGQVVIGSTAATTGTILDLGSSTTSLLLPTGTTGTRPSPTVGMIRYNSTIPQVEAYIGSTWTALNTSSSGTVNSGSQYQLGYYAANGTAISGNSTITTDAANDLLINTGAVVIGTTAPNTGVVLDLGSKTSSMLLPVGTTGTRPAGITGMLRYNSTLFSPEAYFGGRWVGANYTPNQQGYVFNPGNNFFPKLNAAIAKVQANTGNSNWLMLGTSTIGGYCSLWQTWQLTNTMEYLMAQYLQAYGLSAAQANNDSMFGYPVADGTNRVVADTRLVVGAGWGASATISAGGPMYVNTTTTNTIDFTLPTTADKVILYYPTDTGLGTISWQVNAGAVTNIVENATAALGSTTITIAPGANTLHIARVSGTANFIGIIPYLSTISSVNMLNMGYGGVVAGGYLDGSGKPYASPAVYAGLSPDFSVILMDNNDAIANTASATYKANIQLLYNQLTTGDILLQSQIAYGSGAGTISNIASKITDLRALATSNSVPFFNNYQRWGGSSGYTNLSNAGMSCFDDLHGNLQEYQDLAWSTLSQAMALAGFSTIASTQNSGLAGGGAAGSGFVYKPTEFSIAVGAGSLSQAGSTANASTDYSQVAVGDQVLTTSIGLYNVGIGWQAMQIGTSGNRNVAIGAFAGNAISTGANNVAIGQTTGNTVTTGSTNTILGNHVASTTLTTGSSNILIGVSSACDAGGAGNSNELHICGTAGNSLLATGMGTLATEAWTLRGTLALTDIASDATHTDSTICQDTTTHILFRGSGTAGICLGTSSARYKRDIRSSIDGIAQIEQLKPVKFFYLKDYGDGGEHEQIGFLAEEVNSVLPGLVRPDKQGRPNSVDILGMVPVLVKAMQEQQEQINAMKADHPVYHCLFDTCVAFKSGVN